MNYYVALYLRNTKAKSQSDARRSLISLPASNYMKCPVPALDLAHIFCLIMAGEPLGAWRHELRAEHASLLVEDPQDVHADMRQ